MLEKERGTSLFHIGNPECKNHFLFNCFPLQLTKITLIFDFININMGALENLNVYSYEC